MPAYVIDEGGTLRSAKILNSGDTIHKVFTDPSAPPPNPSSDTVRWHKVAVFQNEEPSSVYGGSWTDVQAQAQAKAYDLMVVQSKSFGTPVVAIYKQTQLDMMRATNPIFKMFVYNNAGESSSPTLYANALYAHDASGAKLANTKWGTYPMQPDNPDWQTVTVTEGQRRMAAITYDGQFDDVLGDYPVDLGPVKPGTTTLYTRKEWYNMTKLMGAAIVSANPGKLIIANGLGWGTKYLDRSRAMFTQPGGVQMGVSEGFVRVAGQTDNARPLANWLDELAMFDDANALGKIVICITKDWTTATDAIKDARLMFAFATYLLGNNGTHYFAASKSQASTMTVLPWLSGTNYGTPLGARTVDGNGIYFREFSHASVAVNPTTTSRTVTLRGVSGVVVAPQRAAFVIDTPA